MRRRHNLIAVAVASLAVAFAGGGAGIAGASTHPNSKGVKCGKHLKKREKLNCGKHKGQLKHEQRGPTGPTGATGPKNSTAPHGKAEGRSASSKGVKCGKTLPKHKKLNCGKHKAKGHAKK